jgi:LacI family transcriptional regulator
MRGTPNVALLVEMSNAYARETLHGIRHYMREHGPWTIRFSEQGRGSEPPDWLGRWDGDGILARVENDQLARAVAATGKPAVDFSGCRLLPSMPSVEVDPEAVARLAVDHLLGRGFRHLGYCGVAGFPWSEERGLHFARLLAEAGRAALVYRPGPEEGLHGPWKNSQESVARWVESLPRPVGILAAWDGCALQVIEACRQLGLSVPDDVAVLGVDDDELFCDLADPPLSSIGSSPFQTGRRAAALLDQMMSGREVPRTVHFVQPEAVAARQSTDVLAIDDRRVSEAVRFIRRNACHGINVEDVLATLPMSRRVLEARFKASLGRTPHEEIALVQLRRVKELLAQTDLPLATVARRAGFKHVAYLCALFKKRTGMTPGEYRTGSRSEA